MIRFLLLSFVLALFSENALSQQLLGGEVHGNVEANGQYYSVDSAISAPVVPEKVGLNTFTNVIYNLGNFTAGVRFESYLNALQGFDPKYNGTGVPYRYASFQNELLSVTAGNFYEQFGAGLILRIYEERGLGIDNTMDGIKLHLKPFKGLKLKAIWGQSRFYWSKSPGMIRGADAEFSFNDMVKSWSESKNRLSFGASAVSKFQTDKDPTYNLPENVASFAGRINFSSGNYTLSAEYAYKVNDPSFLNKFIYRDGSALLVNMEYSQKGMGINLGAKRIDNMNFRSDVNATLNDLTINYLPALTKQHTYALPAIYPYATQANGEFGFFGEFLYTFKKGSPLGGKYGTTFSFNYARANAIDKDLPPDTNLIGASGSWGYSSDFFEMGKEVYFEDFNVDFSKKFSKLFKLNLTYLYLVYNKDIIEGRTGYGKIFSHVGVAEMFFKIKDNKTFRIELQHLATERDQGNWAMALIEYSIAPKWFFALLDLYDYGHPTPGLQIHYYNGQFGYMFNTTRIAMGYGKQREGIFCVGGVCRLVPASNGFTLSITSSF